MTFSRAVLRDLQPTRKVLPYLMVSFLRLIKPVSMNARLSVRTQKNLVFRFERNLVYRVEVDEWYAVCPDPMSLSRSRMYDMCENGRL